MSRLFVFLLGVLVGAAGLHYLHANGLVDGDRARPAADARVQPGTDAGPDATNDIDLPALPNPPVTSVDTQGSEPPAIAPMPMPSDALPPPPLSAAVAQPAAGSLLLPVTGITPAQLSDTYTQTRGAGRLHDAIDIMAARGTPVVAVADGRIAKLFNSVPGGLTVYQFDREEKYAYYYAHLDSYAPGLAEGTVVRRGDPIGQVGSTGNASPDGPHLHFAVFGLGPEKSWWKGTAINPFPLLGGRSVRPAVPADAPDAKSSAR